MHDRSLTIRMTSMRTNACEVAVIGAGPYGLSVASHLKHAGIATQVFGEPMSFWRQNMPKGMLLRSPWRATHISHPEGLFSLDAFASEQTIDCGKLLPVEQFAAYGDWFQQRAIPKVDHRAVRLIEAANGGFRLQLADGEIFTADRVIMATGLRGQDYRPPPLRGLPSALVTHTCEEADFARLRGRRVAVIGRGQSACESAALLAEAGVEVEIISRGEIHWLGASAAEAITRKTALSRLRETLTSSSAVGPFPLSWLAEWPAAVWRLPTKLRDDFTRRCLKPGAAGWLKPRLKHVNCNPGRTISGARALSDQVELNLDTGPRRFHHVLLGTGYRIDLARVGILSAELLTTIACADGSPLLRPGFESSVPKLHFIGSYAVKSFGPLMRFIAGAPIAARSVTHAVLAKRSRASEFPAAVGQPLSAVGTTLRRSR
jgi:cation diffusion facilitator CzcD-associated flavoprotein CzcO